MADDDDCTDVDDCFGIDVDRAYVDSNRTILMMIIFVMLMIVLGIVMIILVMLMFILVMVIIFFCNDDDCGYANSNKTLLMI